MDNYDSLLITLLSNQSDSDATRLFDMLPWGIELYDKEGKLVATNKYNVQLFGFCSAEPLLGLGLFHDKALSPELRERIAREEEIALWPYYNARCANELTERSMHVFARLKKLRNEQKELMGYVVLNTEEDHVKHIPNPQPLTTPDPYVVLNTHVTLNDNNQLVEIKVKEVSKEIKDFFGFEQEDLLEQNLLELPIDIPHLSEVGKLNSSNPRLTFSYYAVSTRKYIKWIIDYAGNNDFRCQLYDITDQLMDIDAVRFSLEFFRSVFDESPTAAVFLDTKGRIEDANKHYLELMHASSKKEVVGYRLSRDERINDEMRQKIESNETYQYTQPFSFEQEGLIQHTNRPAKHVRVSSQKFRLPDGTLRGYIIYITDVTKETQENQKLESQKTKAQKASEMKSRFLQNMSHDIRNPLNAIVGFSQLLSLPDGSLTAEEKEEFASHISNNSNMLMMLVDDILNISDVENGNYHISPRPIKLNELLENTIKSIEYRIPCGVKCYHTSDVDDSFLVNTDGRRVQQVLINLLTNACKHTTEGEIRLEGKAHEIPGKVHFSVIDTGTGVDAELADNLFERFSKLDTIEGTGLGLNICSVISEKLNGTINYDKTYTDGAKFDFIIPIN